MTIEKIDITSLLKAFQKLELFIKNLNSEQEKAGAIQAFEYCYELSWKTMQRLLKKRGKDVNSPRTTFREAALEGFIEDPEIWFDFLKKRNITVHTYEEQEADEVIAILPQFSQELSSFIKKIEQSNDTYRT